MDAEILAAQTMLVRDLVLAGISVDTIVPEDGVAQLLTNTYGKPHHEVVQAGAPPMRQTIYETVVEDFVSECRTRGVDTVHSPEVIVLPSMSGIEFCVRGYIPEAVAVSAP